MRPVLMPLLAAATCLSLAQTSFDLVLALDYGTKSIKRYDGSTGAYFGDIGAGRLVRPRFIDRGPNAGEVVVTDLLDDVGGYSSILVFDYNTGVLKRQLFSTTFISLAGISRIGTTSEYWVYDANLSQDGYRIRRVDLNAMSTLQTMIYTGTYATFGSDLTVVGTDVWATGTAGVLRRHPSTGGTRTTVSLVDSTALTTCAGMFRSRSNALQPAFGANNGRLYYASGGLTLATTMTSVFGIGSGHEYDYVAGYSGSVATIQVYNRGFLAGTIGAGTLSQPGDLLVIMAPEPATLFAAGLGLTILARRKRR